MAGKVLLAASVTRDPNAGVAGTVLSVGEELRRAGRAVEYLFSPDSRRFPSLQQPMTYLATAAAFVRIRPHVAIVGSGDAALARFVRPSTALAVHSHGWELSAREELERFGLPNDAGFGHLRVREPAVRLAATRADAVVVQTSGERDFAEKRLGVAADRLVLIPNAVEDQFFGVSRSPTPQPTVVWVGSWLPRKGVSLLPGIVGRVAAQVPDVSFHLVGTGGGTTPDTIRAGFGRHAGHVAVTSRTDRQGILRACSEAAVGLSTSLMEGFGRSTIELMAAGLPVVATSAGIARDVVSSATGQPFDFGDEAGAAEAIALLLQDQQECARRGAAARLAARPYNWRDVGVKWVGLVERLGG